MSAIGIYRQSCEIAIYRQSCTANLMASGFKLLRGIERPHWGNQLWWGCATQFVPNAFERSRQAYEVPRAVVLELGF